MTILTPSPCYITYNSPQLVATMTTMVELFVVVVMVVAMAEKKEFFLKKMKS
jgi:hypothetical protein